jgi:hypothetical protein
MTIALPFANGLVVVHGMAATSPLGLALLQKETVHRMTAEGLEGSPVRIHRRGYVCLVLSAVMELVASCAVRPAHGSTSDSSRTASLRLGLCGS